MTAAPNIDLTMIVASGLLQGFGAEDIAVLSGLTTDAVRDVIADLRARNVLAWIVTQARERARRTRK